MRSKRGERTEGFTLLELMVVVVIIGLLATAVVVNVMPRLGRAEKTLAKSGIETIVTAASMFKLDYHRYPQDLGELVRPPELPGSMDTPDPFLDPRKTMDPWNHEYILEVLDGNLIVRSLGPDGIDGTEDDLTNQTDETMIPEQPVEGYFTK